MWLLPISILVTTTILAIPLSRYLAWIMDGKYRPPRLLQWFESRLNSGPLDWKQYTAALLIFNTVLFVFGFIVLALQPWMPLNGQGKGMLAPSTIFHSVVSFMTNTDVQHYSGDQHFSNFSQIFFAIANFFLSASIGFCALTAIIRALRGDKTIGNFFVDMWRVVMYTFLPAAFAVSFIFLQQGSSDDVRERLSGLDSRAGRDGHDGQRRVEAANDCSRAAGRIRADETVGDQRWRFLRHE